MLPLGKHVVVAPIGGEQEGAPSGVLVRLDAPVAAFVGPVAWMWLTGDEAGTPPLPAESRAACLAAWCQAGLVDSDPGSDATSPDEILATEEADVATALPWPVLTVAVAAECSFCTQLEADLAANAEFLGGAQFGVQLVGDGGTQSFGTAARLPTRAAAGLAGLAGRAARLGTPSGVLKMPGRDLVWLSGYEHVTRALGELSGWDRDLVTEAPTSCSVNVLCGGGVAAHPVAAGDRVIGIGLRGGAVEPLAGYVANRSAGVGYAAPVLLVDRPQSLFLVFRGGEMLARLRTVGDVERLLDTVLAGYAAASSTADGAGMLMLCGALLAERATDHRAADVVLFPRSWLTELVKQQSKLLRAGWAVCPDPFVPLVGAGTEVGAGLSATVHPMSAGSAQAWPATTARVREILVDPEQPDGRQESIAQLRAQVVNWVARPATARGVTALASHLGGVPVRSCTHSQLMTDLTS